MESRKYQLQKQIIEALKAKDNDLYSLLKSQWAHRFGVESLEELDDLDLTTDNENLGNKDFKKNDQSEVYISEVDEEKYIKDEGKEKEITNENKSVFKSVENEDQELFKIKSYENFDNESNENISINLAKEPKIPPKVEALIPLPPKPKYSYLKKWLLRN